MPVFRCTGDPARPRCPVPGRGYRHRGLLIGTLPGIRLILNGPVWAAIAGSALILHARLLDYGVVIEPNGFVLLIITVSAGAFLRHRAIGAAPGGTFGQSPGPYGGQGAAQSADGRQTS